MLWFHYLSDLRNKKKVLHSTIRFGGLLWLLLAGYLVLNKITLGHLVGHYGEKTHFHFDFILIAATEIKFFIKHIFYARFYSYNAKNILFDKILSNPEVTFFCITAILSICILYFIKLRRISAEWHVVFFAVMASLLYILPVSNLYFYHLQIGMNDRYSYIAVSFLMLAIVAALTKCSGGIRYMVIAIILLINIFYQQTTLKYWHDSTLVLKSLKDDFRWHDSPMVFVLNSPDNFEGIVMASISNVPSGIEELIDFQTSHPFTGKMIDVLQYNMTTMNDGVKIEQIGPMQLKVSFNQWGNWWHRYGFGATSYENEYYKVETLDYPYLLTFKSFPAGSTIIYEDGMKWKEFHFMETK